MNIQLTDEKTNLILNGLRALNAAQGTSLENSQKIISLHSEIIQSLQLTKKEESKEAPKA